MSLKSRIERLEKNLKSSGPEFKTKLHFEGLEPLPEDWGKDPNTTYFVVTIGE